MKQINLLPVDRRSHGDPRRLAALLTLLIAAVGVVTAFQALPDISKIQVSQEKEVAVETHQLQDVLTSLPPDITFKSIDPDSGETVIRGIAPSNQKFADLMDWFKKGNLIRDPYAESYTYNPTDGTVTFTVRGTTF